MFGSGNAVRLDADISFWAANALRQFRLVARMRCGEEPFRALKFYKNAARLNFKILKQYGQNYPGAKF